MSWLRSAVVQASRLVQFSGAPTAANTQNLLGRFTGKKLIPETCVTCIRSKTDKTANRTDTGWTAGDSSMELYEPPSPYRKPFPRNYGYKKNIFDGGPLPRPKDDETPLSMPKYRPKDPWEPRKALFGENDYIDILGDGSVHPKDTLTGPVWLRGWRGNEMQRIIRRLNIAGPRLRYYKPTLYDNLKKRVRFLYKRHNVGKRRGGGLH